MNTAIDSNVNRVLFSFVGSSDPTRNMSDGPMLHICRYYRPQFVYLVLTKEMSQRENIYEDSIEQNIDDYAPQVTKIITDIEAAHLFNSYFAIVNDTFTRIKTDHPDAEILVNMSSGTPQITANLLAYIVDAMDRRIHPIQVATPVGRSNDDPPVGEDYDVKKGAENNLDRIIENTGERLIYPDLNNYSRISRKAQIEKLLNQFDYEAVLNLNAIQIFSKSKVIESLLEIGAAKKHLNHALVNEKVASFPKGQYKQYFFNKNEKVRAPRWYFVTDYYTLARVKAKCGDIAGFVIMLEPLTVNIYLCILEDLLNIRLNNLFYLKSNHIADSNIDAYTIPCDYSFNKSTLAKYPQLLDYVKAEFNSEDIKDGFISTALLVGCIKYFIDNTKNADIPLDDFVKFADNMQKIKSIRNHIAHSLNSISADDFSVLSEIKVEDVLSVLENFFTKHFTDKGYRPNMLHIYDNLNKDIMALLEIQE